MVLVEWADALSQESGAWIPIKKVIKTADDGYRNPSISVGFLVKETKKSVVLIAHLSHKKHYKHFDGSGDLVIPKGMILKMKRLKDV